MFLINLVLRDNVFIIPQGIYIPKANHVERFSQKKIGI